MKMETTSVEKLLSAKRIKKIILGVALSDGHIDTNNHRFDFYSSKEEYAKYIYQTLRNISGLSVKFQVKHDKRGYTGYRVITRKHAYWKNLGDKVYCGRKELNSYTVSRVDEEALAHIWMCDGYLEHAKNRKTNKVQNIGWFCLEGYPPKELDMFRKHLKDRWNISSSLVKKPWGYGSRIRVGGKNLQRLVSLVFPYILDCFKYKTSLFYKSEKSVDWSLPSAKQYIHFYECVEDIVRHSQK